jgi:hypothetical protein
MSGSAGEPLIRVSTDRRSDVVTAAIALISQDEFESAQRLMPTLRAYSHYSDWLDAREGHQIGLEMAGVTVCMVEVSLPSFLAWCRQAEMPPSERALEDFAWSLLRLSRQTETFSFEQRDSVAPRIS